MPHRDDHEAARHRIEALERELVETRRRAEVAEAKMRAPAPAPARPTKRPRADRKEKRKQAPDPETRSDPRWPPGGQQRYRWLAGGAALVHAPVALIVLAGAPNEEPPFAVFGAALLAQLVLTYAIGRACGAPFPSNGTLVLLLVAPIILLGVAASTSDMFWGALFADGVLRWFVRGGCALGSLAAGAIVSGSWSADAASSDVGTD